MKVEIERIRRVSDLMCTAHAAMRDQYSRRALFLDLLVLALTTWLLITAFVEPAINIRLTPFMLDTQIWIGLLSAGTFFLTIIQLKTDWKGRADSHKRTHEIYAEVKREAGYLLASGDVEDADARRILARYDMASAASVEIPERQFLKLKRRHRTKIAISKHLDNFPSASIPVVRATLWYKDNFGRNSK